MEVKIRPSRLGLSTCFWKRAPLSSTRWPISGLGGQVPIPCGSTKAWFLCVGGCWYSLLTIQSHVHLLVHEWNGSQWFSRTSSSEYPTELLTATPWYPSATATWDWKHVHLQVRGSLPESLKALLFRVSNTSTKDSLASSQKPWCWED